PSGASAPAPTVEANAVDADAPSAAQPVSAPAAISPRHQLEAWLALMVQVGASDLILRAGGRPSHRVDGKIGFFPGRVPAAGPLFEVLEGIMGKERMTQWRDT